jgi:hypothetical protein
MKFLTVFLLVLTLNVNLFSQNSENALDNTFAVHGIYSKTGIYTGVSGSTDLYKGILFNTSISANLRHLNFGVFTPLVAVSLGFDVLRKYPKITFTPSIRGQLISSRLDSDNRINTTELLVGYTFEYGERFKFVHAGYYGLGQEKSALTSANYISYLISFGIGYAF